jgi:hypothetical protein
MFRYMATGFRLLMAGVVFVMANLHIRGFNLLPDVVGFILVALGAQMLVPFADRFHIVRVFGWILVPLALLLYALPQIGVAILQVIIVILVIALVWTLLGGVRQFAGERDRPDLERHAGTYRRVYLGLALVSLFFAQLVYFDAEGAGVFLTVMAAAKIVLLAFILRLLFVVKHDLTSETASVI